MNRKLLIALNNYKKDSTEDTGYDYNNDSTDLSTENWFSEKESIISNAISNGETSLAESESEVLLKQVLDSSKHDSLLLAKAYYLSGIVQLEKRIWFKAYDRLEKSLNLYECDGDTVAPVNVYVKLAEAYIESQNFIEAERLLNEAINKISEKENSEKDVISLQNLQDSIKFKTEEAIDNDKKDLSLKSKGVHTESIWSQILSLFKRW